MPGGAEIERLTEHAITQFNVDDPAASVPVLLAIRRRVSALPADPVVSDKRQQLDGIIRACLGLEVETVVDQPEVVPGETLKMRHTAVVRARFPVRWAAVRYPGIRRASTKVLELHANQPVVRRASQVLPASTPPSQPYWLREEGTAGLFHVNDPALIGRPENPPAFPIEYVFDVGGQTLVVSTEPVAATESADPAVRRRLDRRSAGLASLHVGCAALRARRRATGDDGAHRRPPARRRHRAAGGARRLESRPLLAAISTGKPRRARPVHLHRDGTA